MGKFDLHIIGGGLAGCEAAWFASQAGLQVALYEMRPAQMTEAHQSGDLAELVCSNSFRSDDKDYNAVGLLHDEMRKMGSVVMEAGDAHRLPAGSALAVDRDAFASHITEIIKQQDNITLHNRHVDSPDEFGDELVIIAAGPLASKPLSQWISEQCGQSLAFFDAIAPIVYYDSIDFDKVWKQSRYDKGEADYINCPFTRKEYENFVDALRQGEKTEFKEWEKDTPYFEACLPIEVMAERGIETLRWGTMKPVGLTNPHCDEKSYAIVQLRQDNKLGSLWNIVGFQTKLKHAEQVRIFRTIPGLENAEFARLGGIHRNGYIRSPSVLDSDLSLKTKPNIYFAGQITGVEGYVESAACGILAGLFASARIKGESFTPPPTTTSMGALLNHITIGADPEMFQPMNVNFGLFDEMISDKKMKGRDRKFALSQRGQAEFNTWLAAWKN